MGGGGGGGGVKVRDDEEGTVVPDDGLDHTSLCMCGFPSPTGGGGSRWVVETWTL